MSELALKLPKPKYGQVVVLQKNGDEPRGHGFPLTGLTCDIGRGESADIRVLSADVSNIHCKLSIDEASGEASLEVLGNEIEVNQITCHSSTILKLNHKDVILVGGRKLRFEYLPPDFKPLPSTPHTEKDIIKAEVVDTEENGNVIECNTEIDEGENVEEIIPSTPSAAKRVSFGPYLSPEQFDNTLPPATPVKRGATPRRSMRYSGLKFTRSTIEPLIEEESVPETAQDTSRTENTLNNEPIVEETPDEKTENVNVNDDPSNSSPPSSSPEVPEVSVSANIDLSSMDTMSTMSDVSNVAVIPSECCSFLDEPVEEDFEPDLDEQESLPQPEGADLGEENEGIGSDCVPEVGDGEPSNGFPAVSGSEEVISGEEEEEEGITLTLEDMTEKKSDDANQSSALIDVQEENVITQKSEEQKDSSLVLDAPSDSFGTNPVEKTEVADTPKKGKFNRNESFSNLEGVSDLLKTPKAAVIASSSPHIDLEDVPCVKEFLEISLPVTDTPKNVTRKSARASRARQSSSRSIQSSKDGNQELDIEKESEKESQNTTEQPVEARVEAETKEVEVRRGRRNKKPCATPSADNLEGVKQLLQTPKPLPETPKADYTDVRGLKKLLQTPKPPPDTPKADYSDVRGVKKLLQTPKPPPDTPKADYSDVRGVKKLLQTPKPAPDTPKADYSDVRGLKKLLQTPKPAPDTPKADYTNVEGVKKLLRTPKAKPETPKADYTDIEGVAMLLQTPHPVAATPKTDHVEADEAEQQEPESPISAILKKQSRTPQADYTDVRGVKKLLQTPKPPPNTPKADYSDVRGVKRLLRTPKAAPNTPKADYTDVEGVDLLMKTPLAAKLLDEPENDLVDEVSEKTVVRQQSISPDSGCQTPSQEGVEAFESGSNEQLNQIGNEQEDALLDRSQSTKVEEIVRSSEENACNSDGESSGTEPNSPLDQKETESNAEVKNDSTTSTEEMKDQLTNEAVAAEIDQQTTEVKSSEEVSSEEVAEKEAPVSVQKGRKTTRGKRKQPSSESEEQSVETLKENGTAPESTDDHSTEKSNEVPPNEVLEEANPPARRRRGAAVAAVKVDAPKPRSRRTKRQLESENVDENNTEEERSPNAEPTEEQTKEQVNDENSSKEDAEKEAPSEEEIAPTSNTRRKGKRTAAPPPTTATRSLRTKRSSESDTNPSESVEENAPKKSRKAKDDKPIDMGSAVPVVRLSRLEVTAALVQDVRVSPKAVDQQETEVDQVVEEAPMPATRRGRPRQVKSEEAVEKDSKKEVAPSRTTRRGKATTKVVESAEPPVVESTDDATASEEVEVKKPGRRAAVKRAVEKVDTVEKRRRVGTSKQALDDVELKHAGKGHAADIHANHVVDDVPPPVEEKTRSTRSKKGLKVHFDPASVPSTPVKSVSEQISASPPEKTLCVVLERNPDIETLAAVVNDEGSKTSTKRTRQKKVVAVKPEIVAESPSRGTKRTRGAKATTEADPSEENSPTNVAPPTRRTRRTRI